MRTAAENAQIMGAITGTAEILGVPLSPAAAAMMLGDLSAYPAHSVLAALSAVRRDSPRRLTLGDVLAKLDAAASPERRSPNEAWALAVRAQDERETVVWTNEMRQAWSAALPLVQGGDMIAARMAFIEAYNRIVAAAKSAGSAPSVEISWGWSCEGRAAALQEGAHSGMLSHDRAGAEGRAVGVYLPAPKRLALAAPAPEEMATAAQFEALRDSLAESLRTAGRRKLEALQREYDDERSELAALKARALAAMEMDGGAR